MKNKYQKMDGGGANCILIGSALEIGRLDALRLLWAALRYGRAVIRL